MISLLIIFYNVEQDPSDPQFNKENAEEETLELKTSAAIGFLISASAILLILYFFLNKISVWVVIVLFCIGGATVYISFEICFHLAFFCLNHLASLCLFLCFFYSIYQGVHTCIVALLSRYELPEFICYFSIHACNMYMRVRVSMCLFACALCKYRDKD